MSSKTRAPLLLARKQSLACSAVAPPNGRPLAQAANFCEESFSHSCALAALAASFELQLLSPQLQPPPPPPRLNGADSRAAWQGQAKPDALLQLARPRTRANTPPRPLPRTSDRPCSAARVFRSTLADVGRELRAPRRLAAPVGRGWAAAAAAALGAATAPASDNRLAPAVGAQVERARQVERQNSRAFRQNWPPVLVGLCCACICKSGANCFVRAPPPPPRLSLKSPAEVARLSAAWLAGWLAEGARLWRPATLAARKVESRLGSAPTD